MIKQLGKYQIEGELGHGAFGRVYQAYDPGTRRRVAIKMLPADADPESLKRFRHEANIAAALTHKNIVAIYEFVEEGDGPYLVMELLQGQTLERLIHSRTLSSLYERVEILYQIAEGLQYAHSRGVVHRDITPANVMFDPDQGIKIMDFGIAAIRASDRTRWTHQNDSLGTILYMAPELFNGGGDERKSDIFAYGVVCYELLTGIHPFRATDIQQTIYRIMEEEPPPLRTISDQFPRSLELLIQQLLHKDPEVRCDSFDDIVLDLTPIRRELRERRAQEIFSGISVLVDSGDYKSSQTAIKQVLELFPEHIEARRLREELRVCEQTRLMQKRLNTLKERGCQLIYTREFGRAIEVLQNALALDDLNEEISNLLQTAKLALGKARKITRLLSDARWEERAGNLEQALELCAEATRLDPANEEATTMFANLQERVKVKKTRLFLSEAHELCSQGRFDQARAALKQIEPESPVWPEAIALGQYIDEEENREKLQRQEQSSRIAAIVHRLIGENKFEEAREVLRSSHNLLSHDDNLNSLVQAVTDAAADYERSLTIKRRIEQIQLRTGEDPEQAMTLVCEALAEFGGEPALIEYKLDLEAKIAAKLRQIRWEAVRDQIQEALAAEQTEVAFKLLEQARSEFSQDDEWNRLFRATEDKARKLQDRQFVSETLEETNALEAASNYVAALRKLDFALSRVPNDPELLLRLELLQQQIEAEEARKRRAQVSIQHVEHLIEVEDFELVPAAIHEAEQCGVDSTKLEELTARGERGRRKQKMATLRSSVLSALEQEDFETAERELKTIKALYGDDEEWQSLERMFRQGQYYATALLMAKEACVDANYRRAKEILTRVTDFAVDKRAQDLLQEIEQKEGNLCSDNTTASSDKPVNDQASPAELNVTPALSVAPASERSAPSKTSGIWLTRYNILWLGVVILSLGILISVVILHTRTDKPTKVGQRVSQDSRRILAKTEWNKIETTQDPARLEAYISSFPDGESTKEAVSRLAELRWAQVDRTNLDALKEYVARYPQSPHTAEANELIADIVRHRDALLDRSQILNAVSAYAASIRHKDDAQLKRIWPGIPDVDLHLWRDSFKNTQSISLDLQPIADPTVMNSVARVYCRRKITKVYSDGRPAFSDNGVIYLVLRKRGTGWIIGSVSAP